MLGRGTVPRAVELWCAREDGDSRSGDAPGLLTIPGDGTSLSDKLATHTDAQGLPDLLVGARWWIVSVGSSRGVAVMVTAGPARRLGA